MFMFTPAYLNIFFPVKNIFLAQLTIKGGFLRHNHRCYGICSLKILAVEGWHEFN